MDMYSHWLERAYPQAIQRQRYFKQLIQDKPISHANFRLAHLLTEKRLTTLVVTPNFDNFLSRALTLFGQPHIVCDHPNTVERIDPESPEIQIIHVHGTYWFYDCCNLRGEIAARTEDTRDRSVTMTSLLDNIFSRHSAIVIGYSAWEGDVIMTALKRRLMSGLPNNLYWFCHRRSGVESMRSLMGAMKNHRDVCLVVPPPAPSGSDSEIAEGEKLTATGSELEPALTAQSILDKLVSSFTREAPTLTRDPIGFFAGQLSKAFPSDSSDDVKDIYALRNVIDRVELVRAQGEKRASPAESKVERIRDANRRSDYRQSIKIAASLKLDRLTKSQAEQLLDLVLSAAVGLNDNSEDELKGYDLVLRLGGAHDDTSHPITPKFAQYVAKALAWKGVALGKLNRYEDSIKVFDEAVWRFGDAPEPALRRRVARALVNKGVALDGLNRHEDEIKAYDEVLRRFGDAPEPALREQIATALFNKGVTLGQLGRAEDEIRTYDELLRRFSDAPEPALREQVAMALFNKGLTLGQLGRHEDAMKEFDQILRQFADAPEPALREHVAGALVSKAVALSRIERVEEAIKAYGEVVQRFGDVPEPALREQVARALVNKGVALRRLERAEDAIKAYDEVLRRFGDVPEPALREQVARALFNKGVALRQLERAEDAIKAFDEVLRRFSDAPELALREQVANALFNKGLALNLLNRPQEATESFREVLRRYANSSEAPLQKLVERARAQLDEGTTDNPSA